MNNFVEELKWRGMVHDMMPGTEEQLQKEMTTAYVGIDPTADSLHIGHLVSVMIFAPLPALRPQAVGAYRRSNRYDRRPVGKVGRAQSVDRGSASSQPGLHQEAAV